MYTTHDIEKMPLEMVNIPLNVFIDDLFPEMIKQLELDRLDFTSAIYRIAKFTKYPKVIYPSDDLSTTIYQLKLYLWEKQEIFKNPLYYDFWLL